MCIPKIRGGGGGGGALLIQSGVLLTIGTCYIVKVRVGGTHHDNKNDDWKGGGAYLFRMGLYTILVKWGWGPLTLIQNGVVLTILVKMKEGPLTLLVGATNLTIRMMMGGGGTSL